jgi:hypothetical protein
MASQQYILPGIAYWAKVFEHNRDKTGFNNELAAIGGQTTIDVDFDSTAFAEYLKTGALMRPKPSPDNEGMMRVKFKRKWTENYGGGEPGIYTADGTPWDVQTMGEIGNGSEVEVRFTVYDTKYGNKGCRLDDVKVNKLVVFESTGRRSGVDFDFQGAPVETGEAKTPKLKEDADIPF